MTLMDFIQAVDLNSGGRDGTWIGRDSGGGTQMWASGRDASDVTGMQMAFIGACWWCMVMVFGRPPGRWQ